MDPRGLLALFEFTLALRFQEHALYECELVVEKRMESESDDRQPRVVRFGLRAERDCQFTVVRDASQIADSC